MGLFVQNVNKFRDKYEAAKGRIELISLSEWFEKQKAIKQNCGLDEVKFEPKSAVVIVGVSGIGKSTFIENFLKRHPEFELCSYDDYWCQAQYNLQMNENATRMLANQQFEKVIRNANRYNKNIILDGLYINLAFRAAVLNTLRAFGYKIHLVYFSSEYTNEKLLECSLNRAVELKFYEDYINSHPADSSIKTLIEIRKKIMVMYSKKLGMSEAGLYESYKNDPKVQTVANKLVDLTQKESKRNCVIEQEAKEAFMYGAHYYYEIQG